MFKLIVFTYFFKGIKYFKNTLLFRYIFLKKRKWTHIKNYYRRNRYKHDLHVPKLLFRIQYTQNLEEHKNMHDFEDIFFHGKPKLRKNHKLHQPSLIQLYICQHVWSHNLHFSSYISLFHIPHIEEAWNSDGFCQNSEKFWEVKLHFFGF